MSIVVRGLTGTHMVTYGLGETVVLFIFQPIRSMSAGSKVTATILYTQTASAEENYAYQATTLAGAITYATNLMENGAATTEQMAAAARALEKHEYSSTARDLFQQVSAVLEAMEAYGDGSN